MIFKHIFCILLGLSISSYLLAQQNQLLLTYPSGENSTLRKGDYIRLSYPSDKLPQNKKPGKMIGLRGKIDSLSKDRVWIKISKRAKTALQLDVENIGAIKKSSGAAILPTLIVNYAIIGGAAILIANSLDVNPAITAFSAVAAIFPASIVTANIFYPAKPKKKVGKDYKLEVITVYN